MKISISIVISFVLLSSVAVQASELSLMKEGYLKVYSIIEFMETNKGIENLCVANTQDKKRFSVYSTWQDTNNELLSKVFKIKSAYESKLVSIAGDQANQLLSKHRDTVMSKVNKTLAPFQAGSRIRIANACIKWRTAMNDSLSSYRLKIRDELQFFALEDKNITRAINNDANW